MLCLKAKKNSKHLLTFSLKLTITSESELTHRYLIIPFSHKNIIILPIVTYNHVLIENGIKINNLVTIFVNSSNK